MTRPVEFTQEELDAAENEMSKAISIGERGTRGDYTELGALYHLFESLGIKPVLVERHW